MPRTFEVQIPRVPVEPWHPSVEMPMSRVYHGFNRRIDPECQLVAIVQIEDSIEVFALDDLVKNQLVQYLCDMELPAKILGVFKREK